MNMDLLYEAVAGRGTVCVGLDTDEAYIPAAARAQFPQGAEGAARALLTYNKALIEATADTCACYKVQIAYYEALGLPGLKAYAETLKTIRSSIVKGAHCLVIADVKRGDIADTAKKYAAAHFSGDFEADFVTLNPCMGMDTLEPWLEWTADKAGGSEKGAFVLMRTSNPGYGDFEGLHVQEEEAHETKLFYEIVGDKLDKLLETRRGRHGYACFGAVVGATTKTAEEKAAAKALRERYPHLFFLIPGYGAQGGAADDAALLLTKGNGGVVNASRSILKAWQKDNPQATTLEEAAQSARKACITMRDAIHDAALNAIHESARSAK
jgi:orotidine-5'-phosphate decarboxylase